MQNSFLRPLEFNYVDTYEKSMTEDEVPSKFKKDADDYQ